MKPVRLLFALVILIALGGGLYLLLNPKRSEQLMQRVDDTIEGVQSAASNASGTESEPDTIESVTVSVSDLPVQDIRSEAKNADGVHYVLSAEEYEERKCIIDNPSLSESFEESASSPPIWLGECNSGEPTGSGIVAWYKEERGQRLYSLVNYLKIDEGVYDWHGNKPNLDVASISYEARQTKQCATGYVAAIFTDQRIDRADNYSLLKLANQAISSELPRCGVIHVYFYDWSLRNQEVLASIFDSQTFARVSLYESENFLMPHDFQNESYRHRIVDSREIAADEISKIRNNRMSQRVDLFLQRTNSKLAPPIDVLLANPYALEGQKITYLTSFQQMVSRNEALFSGPLAYSNVPSAEFVSPGMEAFVAGRVTGTTEINGRSIPKLHYVGAIICAKKNCDELRDY